MIARNNKSSSLQNVPLTFLLVMAVLLLALGWLGWLLLDQDRSLQQQRNQDRVDFAAKELSDSLQVHIESEFDQLQSLSTQFMSLETTQQQWREMPGLKVFLGTDFLEASPASALLYSPRQNPITASPEALNQADRLEFQQASTDEAISLLKQLRLSQDPAMAAPALLRLGRIYFRSGDSVRALAAYADLAEFENHLIENVPARWLAHYARCRIHLELGNQDAFQAELGKLSELLLLGGSGASKPIFLFYAAEVNRWIEESPAVAGIQPIPDSHPLSEAIAEIYFIWAEQSQGRGSREGLRITSAGRDSLILMWKSVGSDMVGRVIDFNDLLESGLLPSTLSLSNEGLGWSILDPGGRPILVAAAQPENGVSSLGLSIGESTITVEVYETAGLVPLKEDIQRRQLLLAGLALVLVVILTSTYFISRSLRREAETAELQTEFVSAVSHEFRTPLTSIRQLSEMLASGRIQQQDKINGYYKILVKESARLQRMVEDLLDFRRMESGAKPYRPEQIEVAEMLEEISDAFRGEYGLDEISLQMEVEPELFVFMDRESLFRSIWNLLDNAVKYTVGDPQIMISSKKQGSSVLIEVRDGGVGIAEQEQGRIFRKFVRGDAVKVTNAKGTGLGLAMIKKALEDQGGSIQVQSKLDEGSIFTIVLEAAGSL